MFSKKRKRESVRSYNIRIYHGSDKQFEYPRVDVNKGLCDFGPGFYATEDYKRAYERALETAVKNNSDKAYVMCFDFHDE